MKTLIVAAASTMMLIAPARAEPVKLDMNQIVGILTSLGKLDGYTKTETIDGKPVQVSVSYMLGGQVRLTLARDASVLGVALNTFKTARLAMQAETKGSEDPKSQEASKLAADTNRLAEIKETYDIDLITAADLKLDTNPIPVDVLTGLTPILKR